MKPLNLLIFLVALGVLISCETRSETDSTPPVVEVTARDYSFQGVPDTLKSGWTTFRLINEGKEPHFILLDYPPEGRGMTDFINEVAQPFDSVWYKLRDGEIDKQQAGQLLGSNLPEWYFSTKQMGGTGMINPGKTAQTTLYLEPGTYVMECYVKTPEGEFHVSVGMAAEFYVSEDTTSAIPPEPNMEITLTNSDIMTEGTLSAGRQTIAVHFSEHPEVGLGNDLHLVRLMENDNIDSIKVWMDWMEVNGLAPPSPAEFLGGTQEMPVGYTSYLTVDLEPGNYAWVTETVASNVRHSEFTVE